MSLSTLRAWLRSRHRHRKRERSGAEVLQDILCWRSSWRDQSRCAIRERGRTAFEGSDFEVDLPDWVKADVGIAWSWRGKRKGDHRVSDLSSVNHRDAASLPLARVMTLPGPFGLCHSPHVLYRVGLALTGLSTEVVREVAIGSDVRGSDPVKTEAGESDVVASDKEEEELCIAEVNPDRGEAGEGKGEESHGERGVVSAPQRFYSPFIRRRCTERVDSVPRETHPKQSNRTKAPANRMQPPAGN
jgi:hypothetical protein